MNGLQLYQILQGRPPDDVDAVRHGRQVLDLRCECGFASVGSVHQVDGKLKLVTGRRRLTRAHTQMVLSDAAIMDFETIYERHEQGTSDVADSTRVEALRAFIELLRDGEVSQSLPALEVPPHVIIIDGLDSYWADSVSTAHEKGVKPARFSYMDVTCSKCRRSIYVGRSLVEDWLPISAASRPETLICRDKPDLSRSAGYEWPADTLDGRVRFYEHLCAVP